MPTRRVKRSRIKPVFAAYFLPMAASSSREGRSIALKTERAIVASGGALKCSPSPEDLAPIGGGEPALNTGRPGLGHQRRAGCVKRLVEGEGQDGLIKVRAEDRFNGVGGGAPGGRRELDASEGNRHVDERHFALFPAALALLLRGGGVVRRDIDDLVSVFDEIFHWNSFGTDDGITGMLEEPPRARVKPALPGPGGRTCVNVDVMVVIVSLGAGCQVNALLRPSHLIMLDGRVLLHVNCLGGARHAFEGKGNVGCGGGRLLRHGGLCRDGGGWPVLSFGQEGKKRRGAGPGRKKAKLQGQLAPSPPPKKQATTTIPTTSAVPAHASSSVLLEWGPLEQACLCKTSAPIEALR